MKDYDFDKLNREFAVTDHIKIIAGKGGIPAVEISNAYAYALVSFLGAHVMRFRPHGHGDILWMSEHSTFEPGKAIRGGIPVCWPWFGDHPTDPDQPAHGFARTEMWKIIETATNNNSESIVKFNLMHSTGTKGSFPYMFNVDMIIIVGSELKTELVMKNLDTRDFTCTSALHTYFKVNGIANVKITGLENSKFIDEMDENKIKAEEDPIMIDREVDRIYCGTDSDCTIIDNETGREIINKKSGSNSTVVWNPWIDKAKRMNCFGDEEYKTMICVETTNAHDDARVIKPGEEHRLAATIGIKS